ncbi:acyl-CoA dehydrogenase [Gordoniibacillus kamchatkensis]|uniref:Acyl-CoA dehydrogenase n=1 Tax=Gordoniibacillus kamchatkensis TaxID=1590651 RepID=A0ABR5A4Y6_9BACL|nr:acyl-CoA dehydrogenase family protein [Paenibacillus sp. VKM B-2647]KIL36084.1 acyl-CoA dehydrogenase [Paenibacillus sp. VKM B-2647]
MDIQNDPYVRSESERDRLRRLEALAVRFAERAAEHDRLGTFPHENIAELRDFGYMKLTVPKSYGGGGISLYEMVQLQERLAMGDGSTALAVGWHVGKVLHVREGRKWEESVWAELCRDIVAHGVMINSFASEPVTGSPSRGGRPATTAAATSGGWLLTGRKTYSTLSPALDRCIVNAYCESTGKTEEFLVMMKDGVTIVETWNTLGMRATGSHDVVFDGVFVPERYLLRPGKDAVDDGGGWLLHIPACYMGIALAARDFALRFACSYRPNSIKGPIAELPNIRQLIGQIELEQRTARQMLYAAADRWDREPDRRAQMKPELGLAKLIATNGAIRIVDLAMRIVGGTSLSKDYPLERYYRDVRAGLHNPPMDDSVMSLLVDEALGQATSNEK